MKPYDELDIVDMVLDGDSDAIEKLSTEIQDRDKAILELWDQLLDVLPYHDDNCPDKESMKLIDKYEAFVRKTRAIYGM